MGELISAQFANIASRSYERQQGRPATSGQTLIRISEGELRVKFYDVGEFVEGADRTGRDGDMLTSWIGSSEWKSGSAVSGRNAARNRNTAGDQIRAAATSAADTSH